MTIITASFARAMGWNWSPHVVARIQEHPNGPWRSVTKDDVRHRKIEKMNRHLYWKREYGLVQTRPLYVWVFWCPGISGFAFRGWWLYLIGIGISEGKYLRDSLKSQVLELFPLVEPDIFTGYNFEKWKKEFVRRFPKGTHCGKPQGKAVIWAEVKGERIERLLRRDDWPMRREKGTSDEYR